MIEVESRVLEILRFAQATQDRDLEDVVSDLIAEDAPILPWGAGFTGYDRNNLCATCRRVYPKEVKFCPKCRRKVRTRGRHKA